MSGRGRISPILPCPQPAPLASPERHAQRLAACHAMSMALRVGPLGWPRQGHLWGARSNWQLRGHGQALATVR